jgi:branched-chain amino acid transport system permease protein
MVKPADLPSEAAGAPLQASVVPQRASQLRFSSLLGLTPWLVPIAIGGLATATTDGFYLHLVIMWGIYSILTLGLNVVIGFAGLLALGQAAFFGFGAYASAIAVMRYDVPYLGALLIAAVVPLVIGLLLAIPFMRLRLRGIYLGMATFGFGEIAFLIFRNWESMTGGSLGMRAIPAPVIFGYEFIDQQPYAYLVIAVLLVVISLVLRLVNTMPGQVLLAVRDDELAASSVGIPTLRYQVAAFGFGAALAGIAGSLFAHYITYLSPENFTSNISILALTMLIVGGRGNVVGSLVGSALLVILPEALRALPELRILTYGALLMLMATLRPQGILGDLRWGQNAPTWTGPKAQRCG